MMQLEKIKEIAGEKFKEDLLYAGVVGSCLVNRSSDVDVAAIVKNELPPAVFHSPEKISILAFDVSWLNSLLQNSFSLNF